MPPYCIVSPSANRTVEYKKVNFLIRKTNSKNEFKKWICEKWISEFEKRNFFIQKRISYSKNEFLIQKMKLVFCWMKEFIPKEYNLDFMNSRFLKWFIMILLDKELIILEMISKHEMGHFHQWTNLKYQCKITQLVPANPKMN